MDKIDISGLEQHRTRSVRAFANGRRGIYGLARLLPDDFEEEGGDIQRPVIDGVAAKYNVPMNYKGELVVFHKAAGDHGCFYDSIARGDNIKLCVDHDVDAVFADKHCGFEVFETDDAVTFRSDVARSKNPMALLGVVASKNRRCASVQCDIQESEVRNCGGKPVRFITKAKLNEISLVKLGLNTPSFAFINDGAKHQPPSAKTLSANFATKHEAYQAERSAIDGSAAKDQWSALSARVTALETQLGIPSEAEHKARIAGFLRGEHDEQYMRLAVFRK